jgi:hypothetical protein
MSAKPTAHLFDSNNPEPEVARRIALEWLRFNPGAQQLPAATALEPYVHFAGPPNLGLMHHYVSNVFWDLVIDRIVVPGQRQDMGSGGSHNFPWFQLTDFGRAVLRDEPFNPHDPTRYLERLKERVNNLDATVLAYLHESLHALRAGLAISALLGLGIASERVFLLLADGLLGALGDPQERSQFEKVLDRTSMKAKLDWVTGKIERIGGSNKRPADWPDTAGLTVGFICNLLRMQRNDLGHPQPTVPKTSTEDAFIHLQIFPRYYEHAEELRSILSNSQV